MNQKRSFSKFNSSKKWQNDDSDHADDSQEFEEEEDFEVKDLCALLRELLEECRKLNMQFSRSLTQTPSILP